MFKKIHIKLTLLFTGITSLIIIVMSISNLIITEKELRQNTYNSFQNDISTLLTNLETQTIITYEWLAKTEGSGKYSIYVYDNNIAYSYNMVSKPHLQTTIINEVRSKYSSLISDIKRNSLSSYHQEITFKDSNKKEYFISFATLARSSGSLDLIVLFPLAKLNHQILLQRFSFLLIDILAISVLAIFCWFFTKLLLRPIAENQKKQTQFIVSASHELRTPLAVILSSLSALEEADNEEKDSFLQIIKGEGFRLSALINDMLLLANSDNQTWTFCMDNVELDTIVLNCFESFESMAYKKKISITVHLPDFTPICYCDKNRITQVLSILLHNAISYTLQGGHIDLTLAPPCIITVVDNGIGISDTDKPYIFDRFYRSDSARNDKEHFGLGLCIAKEIIDAHKGSINILDTLGGGCTFTVTLPCSH